MNPISTYLPLDRRYAFLRDQTLPHRVYGTVLIADVSGFTSLTAVLAQELGPHRGAEELTHRLNHVYGLLIAQVHRFGGSVIAFSGDAITCLFTEEDGRYGVTCALAMQTMMQELGEVRAGETAVPIGIKVNLANGKMRRFLVGDPNVQLMEVLAGQTLDEVAAGESLAKRGEVLVSEAIAKQVKDVQVQAWRVTKTGRRIAVIEGIEQPALPKALPLEPAAVADPVARPWLLPPVYEHLQVGDDSFLAELRPVTPLFLKFGGIEYEADDEAEAKLSAFISWVQSVVSRYEGFLMQLTMGDKGSYVYAVFGALLAHEDDTVRAMAAAAELRELPANLSFITGVGIGISLGQAYSGGYGGAARQTYGVQGNEVNIAARLMQQAQPGQVLVTERVKRAAGSRYLFERLEPVLLKGIAEPFPLFALVGERPSTLDVLKGRIRSVMVGREAQVAMLAAGLRELGEDGRSQSIIIEGEAGIGKSRLVLELMAEAERQGIESLLGAGDSIESRSPYHAYRPLFRDFFGLAGDEVTVAMWRTAVFDYLSQKTPELLPLAPLLNVVLPLDLPESDLTQQMTGEVRAINTQTLLLGLLQHKAERTPLLLVLEDAHWFDSASWALTRLVQRDIRPLLLVIVTRPILDDVPEDYTTILAAAHPPIQLEALAENEVDSLVCQRLGVGQLPPPVSQLIREKAGGHPFFSEELAYALRDTGAVEVVDGACQVTGSLRAIDFPNTIQGVITSRIDRLSPQASVDFEGG